MENHSFLLVSFVFLAVFASTTAIRGGYIIDYLDSTDEDAEPDEYNDGEISPQMLYYKQQVADEDMANDDRMSIEDEMIDPSFIPLLSRDILKSAVALYDDTYGADRSYRSNNNRNKLQKRRGDGRMFSSSSRVLERMPLTVPINVFPRWLLSALGKGVQDGSSGRTSAAVSASSPGSSAGLKAASNSASHINSNDDTDDGRAFSPGKRSPDCMRRCIAQGILHPVQCHSLC